MKTRKEVLLTRRELSHSEVVSSSNLIIKRLLNHNLFKKVKTVFCYLSYNNEVETYNLIDNLLEKNIKIAIPWTSISQKKITPVAVDKNILKNSLVKGPYNILQPDKNIIKRNCLTVESIDICICPGSLFDRKGGRIGYGGGFYDRFLSKRESHKIVKIGLCFDFQLFDKIDQNKHDIKMDYIFSQTETVKVA